MAVNQPETEMSVTHTDGQQALALVLQHPAVLSDARIVCTLLQVSKTFRAAVHQTTAGSVDIVCKMRVALPEHLRKLHQLSTWIPQHAALLRSISYSVYTLTYKSGYSKEALDSAAQDSITQSLQQAAAESSTARGRCISRSWAVCSFGTNMPANTAVLAALPAATLTYLRFWQPRHLDTGWSDALGGLTNLKSLSAHWIHNDSGAFREAMTRLTKLNCFSTSSNVGRDCMTAICQWSHLTSLKICLDNVQTVATLAQLPAQLKELELCLRDVAPNVSPESIDSRVVLKLQHLTNLERLIIMSSPVASGSLLPVQLQHFSFFQRYPTIGQVDAFGISRLSLLQTLTLHDCFEGIQDLAGVITLPKLQHVALKYVPKGSTGDCSNVLGPAATWQGLRQLRCLEFFVDNKDMDLLSYSRVLQQLAALIELTDLRVYIKTVSGDGEVWMSGHGQHNLCICKHITSLTRLNKLSLMVCHTPSCCRSDACYLSTLTALTSLEVGIDGICLDTKAMTRIASELTNLEQLELRWISCSENLSIPLMPVIGQLRMLRSLGYYRVMSVSDARQGLSCLTGLTRLTELNGFQPAGDKALKAFCATVRSHRNPEQCSQEAGWHVTFDCAPYPPYCI